MVQMRVKQGKQRIDPYQYIYFYLFLDLGRGTL